MKKPLGGRAFEKHLFWFRYWWLRRISRPRRRDAHAFNVTLYPLSYEAKTLVDLENVEISASALQVRSSAN